MSQVEQVNGWRRVDPFDVPGEGRVRQVTVDGRSVALTRCGGRLGALENHCPHQGGPLGEGSIEKGLLRCPWHGYDHDPTTGRPPGDFADAVVAYEVAERADGVYVSLPDRRRRAGPRMTVARACLQPRSSAPSRPICRRTQWSPSTSATTPTLSAAT